MKQIGIALLKPSLSKEQVNDWIRGVKAELGGGPLLANKKMLWREGPPGFTYIYGTDIAWRVAWKPYEGETQAQQDAWSRTLPLTLEDSIKAGAEDLR